MRTNLVLIILVFVCTACVERIQFDIIRGGGQVIINGGISDETGRQEIQLGLTSFAARIPDPIEGAQITIFDDQGNSEAYVPDASSERRGWYYLPGSTVQGVPGRTYHLEIQLPDGRAYRSIPEKMPEQPGAMTAINYELSIEEEVSESIVVTEEMYINVFIDADLRQEHAEPYFIRWDVEEVYLLTPTDFPDPFGNVPPPCYVYVYTNAGDVKLFDGREQQQVLLENFPVARQLVGIEFREKHYFSVIQRSISQEAYEYWRKVDQLLSNGGNIFDTPPAPIPGNIYNVNDPEEEVLGYFEASSSSVVRFRTFPSDFPRDDLQILDCLYTEEKGFRRDRYPNYCLDCLSVRNSTHVRPDFF